MPSMDLLRRFRIIGDESKTVDFLFNVGHIQYKSIFFFIYHPNNDFFLGLVCHNLRETGEVSREGVNTLVLGDPALARLGDQLLREYIKIYNFIVKTIFM